MPIRINRAARQSVFCPLMQDIVNGSWLCLHGFAIWQQKGKNGAGGALCWESEQGRHSLWLHGADKVTLAIKSLHFYRDIKVRQSKQLKPVEEKR